MRKVLALFMVLTVSYVPSSSGAPPTPRASNTLQLSMEQYVQLVLKQGEEAITTYNNFENSTRDFKISYRQSRLPKLTTGGSYAATRTEVTLSSDTINEETRWNTSLTQPFYPTGGSLALSASQSLSSSRQGETTSHDRPDPTYNATFTQPLFLFVGNTEWRNWKRASVNYQIATENFSRDIQSIEVKARDLYFDVILKTEQLEVEKVKLQSSKRAYQTTKALVDAGKLAGIELARSEVSFRRDQRRLDNARSNLKQAVNTALEFASLKIDTPVDFTSKLSYKKQRIPLNTLIEFALQHRPDYLAAKRQLELSEISLQETTEANNPTFSAVGSVTHSQNDNGLFGETTTRNWSGSLTLSWPLFDSRITHLQVQSARNSLENSRTALQSLERNIKTEISNKFIEIEKSEEQMGDIRESKEQARKSVEAVRIRYQSGRDRLVDVFNSENDLRDLELEYLSTIITANQAKDRLALAVGAPLEKVAEWRNTNNEK